MKIVFFGTDNFALHMLERLHTEHEVVAVVTTPDVRVGRKQTIQESPVSVLAGELHLNVLKPSTLKTSEIVEQLRHCGADMFVVVVYGKIIPDNILSIPKYKTVNVHPSLLPKYRGPSPIRTPLINGDVKTGVSIMLLDHEVDHGPVLAQKELDIEPDDNNVTLTERLAELAGPLLVETIAAYALGKITPKEQDHANASFTKLIRKEDGKIDWDKPAQEIYNMFRGYFDWPGIWTVWNGQTLKILDCMPVDSTCTQSPGTVLFGGEVACGKGTVLKIRQLQLAGKNATDIQSFLNGYKNFVGSKLG